MAAVVGFYGEGDGGEEYEGRKGIREMRKKCGERRKGKEC